jgi:hypothetical protein
VADALAVPVEYERADRFLGQPLVLGKPGFEDRLGVRRKRERPRLAIVGRVSAQRGPFTKRTQIDFDDDKVSSRRKFYSKDWLQPVGSLAMVVSAFAAHFPA